MGMKIGDIKISTIEPEDAYGFINEKLVRVFPRKMDSRLEWSLNLTMKIKSLLI
jgi:FKBP-type peptidyl-prolyl cis-trans isomerase 2